MHFHSIRFSTLDERAMDRIEANCSHTVEKLPPQCKVIDIGWGWPAIFFTDVTRVVAPLAEP